jgi:hypothetical protein
MHLASVIALASWSTSLPQYINDEKVSQKASGHEERHWGEQV